MNETRVVDPADSLTARFLSQVDKWPDRTAYVWHDERGGGWKTASRADMRLEIGRWQDAMKSEGLVCGDRVAIMARNGPDWVAFDLAAMGLGLVTVPLYVDDRPENAAHILEETSARLLVVGQWRWWQALWEVGVPDSLVRTVCLDGSAQKADGADPSGYACTLTRWLHARLGDPVALASRDDLATLAFTSGTTGRPKGVMLTHGNILSNVEAAASLAPIDHRDRFLSILPLTHTLERTAGLYLSMVTGATVYFARSVQHLGEDMRLQRPTVLIGVPRLYERAWRRLEVTVAQSHPLRRALFDLALTAGRAGAAHRRGESAPWLPRLVEPLTQRLVGRRIMARFGGALRLAISGGAPLQAELAERLIALGMPLLQGYGLTEASPVICVNRPESNRPGSVGPALPGVSVRRAESGELWVRGPNVTQGYWQRPDDTARAIDEEGWLHTGDLCEIDADGHVRITGRLKELIVLSSGQKVPPADLELAIGQDHWVDQVMLVGEGMPGLIALVVPDREADVADPSDQKAWQARLNARLSGFPRHARVRRVIVTDEPWTVDNGLLTPTLKLRRARILEAHREAVEAARAALG
ncbi:MAG: AMP-dependent synthetase/ligase [Halothiobacillaceae bacterium]